MKDSLQTLLNDTNFINDASFEIPMLDFIIALIVAGILSILLGLVYNTYGNVLSNRKYFSKNFFLITETTVLIITVVKSSLALSLGLVGALSIIRFRAAIKEPEELGYLFLAIAIGLGCGANQILISVVSFCVISIVIMIINRESISNVTPNSSLLSIISSDNKIELEKVVNIVTENSQECSLKRFDQNDQSAEMIFTVYITDIENLKIIEEKILLLSPKIELSYIRGED